MPAVTIATAFVPNGLLRGIRLTMIPASDSEIVPTTTRPRSLAVARPTIGWSAPKRRTHAKARRVARSGRPATLTPGWHARPATGTPVESGNRREVEEGAPHHAVARRPVRVEDRPEHVAG